MKISSTIVIGAALIWMAGAASCSYRGLKQDLEAYSPPALVHQPPPTTVDTADGQDAFESEKETIEKTRLSWEQQVDTQTAPIETMDIPAKIVEAASDEGQTIDLLHPRLSLDTAKTLILLRNPSIQAAKDRLLATLEGFDQVTQLDEILRQYSAYTEGVMAGVGPMRGADAIGMRFPFPGVTALKGQVAELNVKAEKETFDMTKRDILAQASKAYWNLLYTHRALGITREMLDRLTHLESVATTRYGAGRTSYQDVIKIRINREKLVEQITTLTERRANLETELLSLMDLKPGIPVGRPGTLAPQTSLPALAELYPLALEKRQELNRLRAMLGKMERMIEMAETMIQPAFSANYSLYTNEAVLQAGSAAMKPTFSTTVSPVRGSGLPKNAWFGTQDTYLRETRNKLDALRAELDAAEARTRLLVRTGWFALDKALRERALYQGRLMELSQTSLEVSTRGYESGNVSFADVITSYTDWLDVGLASRQRDSDVGAARAELERRVGAPLP